MSLGRIIEATMDWERVLLAIGWEAPITLEQVMAEVQELMDTPASADVHRAHELGDVLQVLLRYAARHGIDVEEGLAYSLKENKRRTTWVMQHCPTRIPKDKEEMAALWKQAKQAKGR